MKIKITGILFSLLLLSFAYPIEVDPWFPVVGQRVKFKISNQNLYAPCYDIVWDFGDGTQTHANYLQSTRDGVFHIYKRPGTYTVKIVKYYCHQTAAPPPEKAKFTVKDDRKLAVKIPAKPWPDFEVILTLVNAKTPSIRWNFGDGTIETSGATTSHKFKAPGVYTVKAFDFGGTTGFPIETRITIQKDTRELFWTPEIPKSGEMVRFEAKDFISPIIKWDFGDGFTKTGRNKIFHIYRKHGFFTVKATDLKDNKAFERKIRIEPGKGVAINLTLKNMEMYFMENHKKFVVVPLGTRLLSATARIRFEGTGLLQGFWTVDGAAFSSFNHSLPPKKDFSITVASVPTTDPGLHVLSIKLIKPRLIPAMDIKIPHIFYFVSRVKKIIETEVIARQNEAEFLWQPIPSAALYRVLVGRNPEEIYRNRNKGITLKNTNHTKLALKPGRYTGIVLAEDKNGVPLTSSDFIEFEISK